MKKVKPIIGGILGIAMAFFLIFFDSCGSKNDSTTNDFNQPAYYYGTWSSPKNKIEVTFLPNETCNVKITLGNEPIEYKTEWAVSENTGAIWKDKAKGNYSIMAPNGHLYGYDKYSNHYSDQEIYLQKK